MLRTGIQLANLGGLILIVLGLPSVAGCDVGRLRLSHAPTATLLMICGTAIWAAGNALTALWFCRRKADRRLCWHWASIFLGLAVATWTYRHGWLDFHWLQRLLLWVRDQF